ncbi:MAG TPA: stage V sporulation protein AD [Candidatus Scybalocola faecipullorum]|nr:stage V sporulation protein AD [Candidatus Scybalocola faecipullorum]
MKQQRIGKRTIRFRCPPSILAWSGIVGQKEGEGPLGSCFDRVGQDAMFGEKTWEAAESAMQKEAIETALKKGNIRKEDIDCIFAGDLLGQLIATSFGLADFSIPLFGVYGACSTMGESMGLAAMAVDGGYAQKAAAVTSSHFASAEKTFRFPLDYGNQRPLSATWTVTGSGAVIIGEYHPSGQRQVRITAMTAGRIVDYGIKDSMNMGACMAPAAADTLTAYLNDTGEDAESFDKIITGDLGYIGQKILIDLMRKKNIDISLQHTDCGIEIYDKETQDTHAGGSGCGCSAVTLTSWILPRMLSGEWRRVFFMPTGALLSPISFNEGQSVPGIAHGIVLEAGV